MVGFNVVIAKVAQSYLLALSLRQTPVCRVLIELSQYVIANQRIESTRPS